MRAKTMPNKYIIEFVVTGWIEVEAENKLEAGRSFRGVPMREIVNEMALSDVEVDHVLLTEGKEPVDEDSDG
jgi:hypothetical protein